MSALIGAGILVGIPYLVFAVSEVARNSILRVLMRLQFPS